MGYKYNYTRTYTDGLEKFLAPVEFKDHFQKEHTVVNVSNSSYYNLDKLINSINEFFKGKEIITKKLIKYFDYNKTKIISEIVFINKTDEYLISLVVRGLENIVDEFDELDEEIDEEDEINPNEIGVFFEGLAVESSEEKMTTFFDTFLKVGSKKKKVARELNIIVKDEYGLALQPFTVKKTKLNIEDNYNDDFNEINNAIISSLNKKDAKGVFLFSGIPGTGKTTYIRYLTQKIKNKNIIYMSPDMSNVLTDPEFIGFMIKNKNSVLIIEDAENILKKRSNGGNQAVSNLLNVSDGLLADVLKIQIICTFNCNDNEIDEALRRKGRLIQEYKFDKLPVIKTNRLLKKIFPDDEIKNNECLTLAEIYNFKTNVNKVNYNNINKIGFLK